MDINRKEVRETCDITNDFTCDRSIDLDIKGILLSACASTTLRPDVMETLEAMKGRKDLPELKAQALAYINKYEKIAIERGYKYVEFSLGKEIISIQNYFGIVRYQINHFKFDPKYKDPRNYKNIEIVNEEFFKNRIIVSKFPD